MLFAQTTEWLFLLRCWICQPPNFSFETFLTQFSPNGRLASTISLSAPSEGLPLFFHCCDITFNSQAAIVLLDTYQIAEFWHPSYPDFVLTFGMGRWCAKCLHWILRTSHHVDNTPTTAFWAFLRLIYEWFFLGRECGIVNAKLNQMFRVYFLVSFIYYLRLPNSNSQVPSQGFLCEE